MDAYKKGEYGEMLLNAGNATFTLGSMGGGRGNATANGAWRVGAYNQLKGTVPGMDAHHVGQRALFKRLIPGYDENTAPSILVPKPGHTQKTLGGLRVSTNMNGFTNARQVLARDIFELRRVYGPQGIPNGALQQLIEMNKTMYPQAFIKQ